MYENSRFLKHRFTFCGINTNFGQQWAPPAYYHLTPIVSKGNTGHNAGWDSLRLKTPTYNMQHVVYNIDRIYSMAISLKIRFHFRSLTMTTTWQPCSQLLVQSESIIE